MKYLIYTLTGTFFLGLGVVFVHLPRRAEAKIGKIGLPQTPAYLASKKGEVFGLPWCGVIPRIKAENIVILSHKIEALDRGLRVMKGCRGLSENP